MLKTEFCLHQKKIITLPADVIKQIEENQNLAALRVDFENRYTLQIIVFPTKWDCPTRELEISLYKKEENHLIQLNKSSVLNSSLLPSLLGKHSLRTENGEILEFSIIAH